MTKSEAEMRKEFEEQRTKASALLAQGKTSQVVDEFVLSSKRELEELERLPFRGRHIGEAQGYKEAKRIVGNLFAKVDRIYRGAVPYPLQELLNFSDPDYAIALTQSFDVWGLVESLTSELDPRLKVWLVLGIYSYQYEFSAKALISLATVLTAKPCEKTGSALNILRDRFGATDLESYFDPFLRNAIDHSEFILKDKESGRIEAWRMGRQGKVRKEYALTIVSDMTVNLLFFSIGYLASYHERVLELHRTGHLRIGTNKI